MDNTNKKLTRKDKKALKKQNRTKRSSADKKGIALNVVLGIIVAVLLVNAVSAYNEEMPKSSFRVKFNQNATVDAVVTVPPVTVPQESITTQAPQEESTTNLVSSTEADKPQTDTLSDQEILDIITNGINTLKSNDASFIGHKVQVLDMELTECTVPGFAGIVNRILNMFIETEIYDFDFTNGKGMDPENKVETTTMETFPPVGKNFALTIDGVAEATKEIQGENTVYRVKLKAEKSTKDNPKTLYHENACDTLDLSTFNMPIGEITKADLEYPGATVGVTLDKDGRIVGYYERLDIIGEGEATAIGMSGGGKVVGYVDETWTIEWK